MLAASQLSDSWTMVVSAGADTVSVLDCSIAGLVTSTATYSSIPAVGDPKQGMSDDSDNGSSAAVIGVSCTPPPLTFGADTGKGKKTSVGGTHYAAAFPAVDPSRVYIHSIKSAAVQWAFSIPGVQEEGGPKKKKSSASTTDSALRVQALLLADPRTCLVLRAADGALFVGVKPSFAAVKEAAAAEAADDDDGAAAVGTTSARCFKVEAAAGTPIGAVSMVNPTTILAAARDGSKLFMLRLHRERLISSPETCVEVLSTVDISAGKEAAKGLVDFVVPQLARGTHEGTDGVRFAVIGNKGSSGQTAAAVAVDLTSGAAKQIEVASGLIQSVEVTADGLVLLATSSSSSAGGEEEAAEGKATKARKSRKKTPPPQSSQKLGESAAIGGAKLESATLLVTDSKKAAFDVMKNAALDLAGASGSSIIAAISHDESRSALTLVRASRMSSLSSPHGATGSWRFETATVSLENGIPLQEDFDQSTQWAPLSHPSVLPSIGDHPGQHSGLPESALDADRATEKHVAVTYAFDDSPQHKEQDEGAAAANLAAEGSAKNKKQDPSVIRLVNLTASHRTHIAAAGTFPSSTTSLGCLLKQEYATMMAAGSSRSTTAVALTRTWHPSCLRPALRRLSAPELVRLSDACGALLPSSGEIDRSANAAVSFTVAGTCVVEMLSNLITLQNQLGFSVSKATMTTYVHLLQSLRTIATPCTRTAARIEMMWVEAVQRFAIESALARNRAEKLQGGTVPKGALHGGVRVGQRFAPSMGSVNTQASILLADARSRFGFDSTDASKAMRGCGPQQSTNAAVGLPSSVAETAFLEHHSA